MKLQGVLETFGLEEIDTAFEVFKKQTELPMNKYVNIICVLVQNHHIDLPISI